MAYETGTITGTFHKPDGTPHSGSVRLTPNAPVIRDQDGNVVLTGSVSVKLVDGAFSVELPASDDLTLDPAGVTFSANVRLTGAPSFQRTGVFVATDETVDLADIGSLDPVAPSYQEWVNAAETAASEAEAAQAASEAAQVAAETAAAAADGSADAALASETAAAASAVAADASADEAGEAAVVALKEYAPPIAFKYIDGRSATSRKLGPVTTDITSVTPNATPGGTFTRQYVVSGTTRPAGWPADEGEGLAFAFSGQVGSYGSAGLMQRSLRFMMDGTTACLRIYAAATTHGFAVYVDGLPTSLTPYAPGVAGLSYVVLTFPSAKPRLIEFRTNCTVLALYAVPQYKMWQPSPRTGPRVLVLGDSFAQGAGATTNVLNGIYNNIGPSIASEDVWVDGIGGTGFGVTAAANGTDAPLNRYIDRAGTVTVTTGFTSVPTSATWDVETIAPDMVVVQGGGLNDLVKGRTTAQVIADATSLFTTLRTKLPDARLVFVEGFGLATFASLNPSFIAIRAALQTALTSVGVYYIDVATTDPWIFGTGKVGTTTGDGNSDIYTYSDGSHPTDAGHLYIRSRLAPKLRAVLDDDGSLVNGLL